MLIGCALVATMAMGSTAVASPPPADPATATAASSYGAKVKHVLDVWAKTYPGVGEQTPIRLRRQVLEGSAVTRDAATSLTHIEAPARWRPVQRRTRDALRAFASTLHTWADRLKGKKTTAQATKVRASLNKRFFHDAGAVGTAMAELRKAT